MAGKRPRARKGKNVKCVRCGNTHGVIRKYGLMLCRQCFREMAEELGFRQYM